MSLQDRMFIREWNPLQDNPRLSDHVRRVHFERRAIVNSGRQQPVLVKVGYWHNPCCSNLYPKMATLPVGFPQAMPQNTSVSCESVVSQHLDRAAALELLALRPDVRANVRQPPSGAQRAGFDTFTPNQYSGEPLAKR